VIVLSAREPSGNKQRALQANASAYFQKPPDNHQFLSAIRHALGESTGMSTFLTT
jgi:CheY-like chemotaxis protein